MQLAKPNLVNRLFFPMQNQTISFDMNMGALLGDSKCVHGGTDTGRGT